MEEFIVPPTTTATTMYHKEKPTNIQNRWISNMGRSQNCHIFPIIEGQSVSSAYSMSHSQFHHSSYNLQAHEAVKFPYLCPSEHVFPLVLPSYPYQVDQIGNEIKTPNSVLRDIPNGVPSNGHVGDKVRNTCFMQSLGLSKLHEQERLHAMITRAARNKRKMARQKSASLKRNLSNGGSSAVPSSNRLTACAIPTQSNNRNEHKDLYTFCTPDKKRLRILLTKELKKSDVANLGRIILPKREAEENLPSLSSKDGILIVIRDVYSSQEWSMRYRFWSNNNSRMYVLENTGNFVEQNGLDSGDLITFYEDESQNLYFSIKRAEKVAPKPSKKPSNSYFGYIIAPFTKEALDEEDSSLEILMEELQHKEEEAKSLMTL